MIGIYKLLTKILQGIINLLFVLQIALMILVFLTATYWFLSLINVSAFDFAKPIADSVSEFVHLFYKQDVELASSFNTLSSTLTTFLADSLFLTDIPFFLIRTQPKLYISLIPYIFIKSITM